MEDAKVRLTMAAMITTSPRQQGLQIKIKGTKFGNSKCGHSLSLILRSEPATAGLSPHS
jgi:RNA:NAD 2'-phosphotransferase (TPT1/KptA family)